MVLDAAHDLVILVDMVVQADQGRMPMDQVVEAGRAILKVSGVTPAPAKDAGECTHV